MLNNAFVNFALVSCIESIEIRLIPVIFDLLDSSLS